MNPLTRSKTPMRVVCLLLLGAACGPDSQLVLASPDGDDTASAGESLITQKGSHFAWRVTSSYLSREVLIDTLTWLQSNSRDIDAFATAPNGAWVIVSGGARWYSGSFPGAPRAAIEAYLAAGKRIAAIDFNSAGGWVVVTTALDRSSGGVVPAGLVAKLDQYRVEGWSVEDVDITETGYVVVGNGSLVSYSLPGSHPIEKVLADRHASKRKVRQVDLGFDGRWAVVSDQEPATNGVGSQLLSRLHLMAEGRRAVSRLMFGLGDDYVVYTQGTVAPSPGAGLLSATEAVEYDVGGKTLWQAMADANIPGLSIAIIRDNQVVSVRGYGVLKAGEQAPVIASTPFDLASLTKFVASLTLLKLADEGSVELFTDILDDPGFSIAAWNGWGSNPLTAALYGMPGTALPSGITPARLMRHRAGIDAQGGSPDAHPDNFDQFDGSSHTVQQLLGWDCGSSSGCVYSQTEWAWATAAPNGPSVYSNQNFLLVQAIAEDATGKRGVELYEQKLFTPMGLANVSARIPLAASFEARAAWPHDTTGAARSYRALYPFVYAGGLFASAGDYAELMILALNQGRDSSGVARITPARIDNMLNGIDRNAGFGLFFEGGNTALEGTDDAFRHTGSHSGRARTWMCGNPTRDEGIVVLTNRGKNDAGDAVIRDIMTTYTRSRGWPTNCQ